MRVLSKSPLGYEVPSWRVLKCDDEKSYYNETISSQEKKIGSRILREKGLDYVFQPKKNSNGIGSWVEMGKVAEEEEGDRGSF